MEIKHDCIEFAQTWKDELKEKTGIFSRKPCLAVICVDPNKASRAYVNGKRKDCEEVGVLCRIFEFAGDDINNEVLIQFIRELGRTDDIDGIIVQLPLPEKFRVNDIQRAIPREKDVDGFRHDSMYDPCTPKGIIRWLKANTELKGKVITVIGRSRTVGRPLADMLIDEDATVICCHSKTECLEQLTYVSDIVVSAVGKAGFIGWPRVSRDCKILVDVGINYDSDGKLCGDVHMRDFAEHRPDTYVTPVPGGVGLLTRAALIDNVVAAYEWRNKL